MTKPSLLELKIPPLALFLISMAAAWLAAKLTPAASIDIRGADWIAIALLAAGATIGLAGIVEFRRRRTTVDPMSPHKASHVVTSGVFRWTRNPMYLGLAIGLLAWIVYLGNLIAVTILVAFVGFLDRFQIRPEERIMQCRFGDEYRSYLSAVRRWL